MAGRQAALPALPPLQKEPTGHREPLAEVEPGAQAKPGSAEQGRQLEAEEAALKLPAGQSVQLAAPAEENEPSGHSVALMELKGQYEPAGQRTGAPEEQ